ncbi:MAG: hypothetical protein AB8B66_02265 [Rickettsiaceae bacterium]
MINTKHLQKKGQPLKRDQSLNITNNQSNKKPLQVMLTQSLFEEFSSIAAKKFGYTKGSKTKLFLEIWKEYQDNIK